jgi:hypothetical protein
MDLSIDLEFGHDPLLDADITSFDDVIGEEMGQLSELAKLFRPKPTKGFPYVYKNKQTGKTVWATLPGAKALKKQPKKFSFVKFNGKYATADQKSIHEALKKMDASPKKKTGMMFAPGFKGFDPEKIKKIAKLQPKKKPKKKKGMMFAPGFKGFKADQWKGLAKLQPKVKAPVARAPITPRLPSKLPKNDIEEIKNMLAYAEAQRIATHEHKQIVKTKQFRKNVLDRLLRISEAVLDDDHPISKKLRRAKRRG